MFSTTFSTTSSNSTSVFSSKTGSSTVKFSSSCSSILGVSFTSISSSSTTTTLSFWEESFLSETFEIIVSRKVESISINKEELKVSYNYGEEIDLSNLVVKVIYVDSGESDILNHGAALGGYAIDLGNYDPYAPGKYTITVYYLNVNTTFEVEVKSNGNIIKTILINLNMKNKLGLLIY